MEDRLFLAILESKVAALEAKVVELRSRLNAVHLENKRLRAKKSK